jgi:hypothetical protein
LERAVYRRRLRWWKWLSSEMPSSVSSVSSSTERPSSAVEVATMARKPSSVTASQPERSKSTRPVRKKRKKKKNEEEQSEKKNKKKDERSGLPPPRGGPRKGRGGCAPVQLVSARARSVASVI